MNKSEEYRDQLLSSIDEEALTWLKEKSWEYIRLMSYYRCALMEIETKFNVLNEQFSLQYDRNPIETIKTRLKSAEGIVKKIKKKNLPFALESITENINDVAGVRVICSFVEDIYMLSECLLSQDDIRLQLPT